MALVILHDPYEWFDPERGRQGVLIHTSQLDGRKHMVYSEPTRAWPEVWSEFDNLPPFIIDGEWVDPKPMQATRRHPYGVEAYQVTSTDGKVYIYPNEEAARAHEGSR